MLCSLKTSHSPWIRNAGLFFLLWNLISLLKITVFSKFYIIISMVFVSKGKKDELTEQAKRYWETKRSWKLPVMAAYILSTYLMSCINKDIYCIIIGDDVWTSLKYDEGSSPACPLVLLSKENLVARGQYSMHFFAYFPEILLKLSMTERIDKRIHRRIKPQNPKCNFIQDLRMQFPPQTAWIIMSNEYAARQLWQVTWQLFCPFAAWS